MFFFKEYHFFARDIEYKVITCIAWWGHRGRNLTLDFFFVLFNNVSLGYGDVRL